MIACGLLNTVVGIMQPTDTTDALGRPNPSWATKTYVRAEVRDVGAVEGEWGGGPAVIRTFDLVCRWPTLQRYSVTERWRVAFNGRTCSIVAIQDMKNKHRTAIVRVVEVVE